MGRGVLPRLSPGARDTLVSRAAGILETWTGNKSPATTRAYASDLTALATWAGASSHAEAVAAFLSLGPGKAYGAAQRWQGAMHDQGLAPRTIARRLSMLCSVVKTAKRERAIAWTLDVEGPKAARGTVRDTTGPPPADVARMLAHTARARDGMAARDLAVLYLLVDSGLRRSELCSLHVRHVHLPERQIFTEEKGAGRNRIRWHVSPRARDALARWLRIRSSAPGPLFGIVASTVYRIVVRRAVAAGFPGWHPHGFRHTGGTELARRDPKAAQLWLRHRDVSTTLAWYRDVPSNPARQLVDEIARICSLGWRDHARARRARRGQWFRPEQAG